MALFLPEMALFLSKGIEIAQILWYYVLNKQKESANLGANYHINCKKDKHSMI